MPRWIEWDGHLINADAVSVVYVNPDGDTALAFTDNYNIPIGGGKENIAKFKAMLTGKRGVIGCPICGQTFDPEGLIGGLMPSHEVKMTKGLSKLCTGSGKVGAWK